MAIEKYPLHPILTPIDYDERLKILENWTRITSYFNDLKRELNALAGGEGVDLLLEQIDVATQDAITAKNNALQAINDAEIATLEAIEATESAEIATELANQSALDAKVEADFIKENKMLIEYFVNQQTNLQSQINQLVIDGDSSPEAAQARVDNEDVTHSTLKGRIDSDVIKINQKIDNEIEQVTTQLAQTNSQVTQTKTELDNKKADKSEVNNLATAKANKSYVDTNISTLDTKINAQASGSPKGTYATLSALQTAFPIGNSSIYVVTADGNWYYWNNSAWTSGGTYQSTGLSRKTVKQDAIGLDAVSVDKVGFIEKISTDVTPSVVHYNGVSAVITGGNLAITTTGLSASFKTIELPIENNFWYTLSLATNTNRFRLALVNKSISQMAGIENLVDFETITVDDLINENTFYNSKYKYAILYYTSVGDSPNITAFRNTSKIHESLISKTIKSAGFPFPNDLVAFWDFTEDSAPYYSKAGVNDFPLNVTTGSSPKRVNSNPFGGGLSFNGSSDFLEISAEDVGALNVAKSGDQVTVVAWVNMPSVQGFVAGLWQEDDNDPKRQYGMFVNLPLYGGEARVCGHISRYGGASPGLPYSRDYSTSGTRLAPNTTRCIGFTYDGYEAESYVDGISDIVKDYTEPNAPAGEGLTYDKNPYKFDLGLNRNSISSFTVGAVRLTNGMGNHFKGTIAAIAIFRRALTSEEMMKIHLDALPLGEPIQYFDFSKTANTTIEPVKDYGWVTSSGATAVENKGWLLTRIGSAVAKPFAFLSTESASSYTTKYSMLEKTGLEKIRLSQIGKVEFTLNNKGAGNNVKLCIKVNGQWYATVANYGHAGNGVDGANWNTQEIKSIPISRDKVQWLNLNYVLNTNLSLGTQPTSNLPNGEVTGIGILSNPMQADSVIRITDMRLYS